MSASPTSAPSALRQYATEALKQHAYKRLAMAQISEFGRAFGETRETARRVLEGLGAGAIEVSLPERPGASVYVQRVRRRAPGSLTQRRLEEIAMKPLGPESVQQLRQIASDVQAELEAEAAREAKRQDAESRKRQRKEAAELRKAEAERKRREKEEREAARSTRRAAASALERRVQQGVRQLERAEG
jgi:hypothetical protein